ncbi:limonene-1,2-epoxide hydrolase family protein [Pseudomonas sp. zbq_18]|uniref:limonene-1,2-epoxide hydrolase family protein n=1 Tax=Pseudomonas sp. zbq_18 TaxID=3367251 RepID=UPI00370AD65E
MSIELVQRLFVAAEQLDEHALVACLHERCVFHTQPLPEWTAARGLSSVRRHLRVLLWWVSEFRVLGISRTMPIGDALYVERVERLRVLGRTVELEVAAVFRFRDGRILLWQDRVSVRALLRQLFWPRRGRRAAVRQ